jgi:hypothetical protein
MARKALMEAVLSKVVVKAHGPKNWFERLPPAAQKELGELRDYFYREDHGIPKKAFALGVIEAAKERGWKTSGVQGVVAWLNERA